MHLKKLEIQGFKSFPEYTLIEFDKGMTAIVGPNGSGKSNVTDAIRWVLGEQSVRTLRGGKMEDVIFNGTQSRRAMNYAEVSMTIDNTDGQLGIDYSEVQVTRRLYRSGESEYLINHVNCRLKDIVSLFMDTGLGKDGYSIVGQGRIDDILSSRSEDRRKVLEEASGIVKYKVRKDEAERKLLSTEQNLIRISDILSELSEQVGPLEEQAQKAKEYHRYYDDWKKLDVGLIIHSIDYTNAFLSTSDAQLSDLQKDISEQENEIVELRDRNRSLTEKSSEIELALETARDSKSSLSEKIYDLQSRIAVIRERSEQINARLSSGFDEDQSAKDEMDNLESDIQRQQSKLQTLKNQLSKYKESYADKEQEMLKLSASFDEAQKKQAECRAAIENLSEKMFEAREIAQSSISEQMVLDSKVKTLETDRMISVSEKDSMVAVIQDLESEFKIQVDQCAKMAAEITASTDRIRALRQEDAQDAKLLEQKNRELDNVVFRIRTVEELEKSKEGYQEPVRRLLSAAENDPEVRDGIVGVLGELISVSKDYETAIEIALGSAVHNVVTHTDKDASGLITYLKENKLGRVTFLPVNNIRPRSLEDGYMRVLEQSQGYIGKASDLLKTEQSLRDIIDNLLGRIAVFDTMEHALLVAKKTSFNFRIVTLDGDVINPGGSMTGGSIRRQGLGLLGRTRELEELKKRFVSLEAEVAQLESIRIEKEHEIKLEAKQQAALDEKFRDQSMERVKAESTLQQHRINLDKIQTRLEKVSSELSMVSKQRLEALHNKEDSQELMQEYEQESLRLKASVNRADEDTKEVQAHLDDLRAELGDLKVSVESLEISAVGAQEILDMYFKDKESRTKRLESLKKERVQSREELVRLAKDEEDMQNLRQQLLVEDESIQAQMKTYSLEKEEIEHKLSGFIDRLSASTSKLSSLQNEMTRVESKRESHIQSIDEVKNRLWEDHELTYDNAQDFRMEIDNVAKVQKQMNDLKSKLKAIGPVNMNAVEEFNRISERFTFMSEQKQDIETAKDNLQQVINELVEEMKKQFMTHFEQINENFKIVFSDLFNGGTAEILLENIEDVLGSGIDIKAQPPGKKLQSLSLLSGGERCLTAIALLFAILQLRPSPFCVLDEVEAALDDVNVTRFTDFVRRYTTKSQFILVTHRKGTMEACDRMYGVTMQERGISKILSMRLGDQ